MSLCRMCEVKTSLILHIFLLLRIPKILGPQLECDLGNYKYLLVINFQMKFLKEVNCGIPEINIWLEKKEEIRGGVLKNHSCMWLLIFVHLVYLTL